MESNIRECPCCGDTILGKRKIVLSSNLSDVPEDSKLNYTFHCPQCGLTWSWYDTDAKEILIDNYKKKYESSLKEYPQEPSVVVDEIDFSSGTIFTIIGIGCIPFLFLFGLHILSYMVFFFTFTFWDPRDTTWGYITGYGFWALMVSLGLLALMILSYVYKRVRYSFKNRNAINEYRKTCEKNRIYNENLKRKYLDELNVILSSKDMGVVSDFF